MKKDLRAEIEEIILSEDDYFDKTTAILKAIRSYIPKKNGTFGKHYKSNFGSREEYECFIDGYNQAIEEINKKIGEV